MKRKTGLKQVKPVAGGNKETNFIINNFETIANNQTIIKI